MYFWKCNFPMNHNVCLSVCRSVGLSVCLSLCLSVCLSVCQKKVVRILGKCRVLLLKNSSPPLQLYKDKPYNYIRTNTHVVILNFIKPENFRYDRLLHFHWTLIVLVVLEPNITRIWARIISHFATFIQYTYKFFNTLFFKPFC